MKINLDTVLTDYSGKAIKAGEPKYKLMAGPDGIAIVNDRGHHVPQIDAVTGEPVILESAKDLTLHAVCVQAMHPIVKGDDALPIDDKLKQDRLARKVAAGGEVDLKSEEVSMLKDRIGKLYKPMVIGQCFDLLDPPAAE